MSTEREYEKNLEIEYIEINQNEYNEKIKCVIKWLLEMNLEADSLESISVKEAA